MFRTVVLLYFFFIKAVIHFVQDDLIEQKHSLEVDIFCNKVFTVTFDLSKTTKTKKCTSVFSGSIYFFKNLLIHWIAFASAKLLHLRI